ncbi:MAG: Ig-like domain-containing protein [Bacteroidetes bacterium]|nr:Ig-like domain-containing protein [Bacteroidota bacterium]
MTTARSTGSWGLLLILIGGCATPIRPSGGPVDSTPPRLLSSVPANGDVRVEAERVVLEFSEQLDESSASRAVAVAPTLDSPPQIRVRGRRLEIAFPDSLRPQTTYVISLSTELKDEHGVALQRPITMAFATGDVLDRGRIAGRLLNPASNSGVAGFQLFAYALPEAFGVLDSLTVPPDSVEALFSGPDARYRLPDPRTDAPTYSSEATGDGSFQFDYLWEGPYFVVALEDLNRNRRADDGERFAVSARPISVTFADSLAQTSVRSLELFVAAQDTTPPRLRRARPISNQRIALSFDEPVRLQSLSADEWSLTDSASGEAARLAAIYQLPHSPTEIMLLADDVLSPTAYLLSSANVVADSSGNTTPVFAHVKPSTSPDTVSVRFEGFLPASEPSDSVFLLRPDALPGVRFNEPVDSLAFQRRVIVSGPDGSLEYALRTEDGISYSLRLASAPRTFRVEVRMPDSTYTRRYAVPAADALGSISGFVVGHGERTVQVEAFPEGGPPFVASAEVDGTFVVRRLPPGSYRLRLFVDRNGNGRWDGGSLAPFAPPEPLQWLSAPISVRARWEHEIEEAVDFSSN